VSGSDLLDAPDPDLARVAWERVATDPHVREVLERPDVRPIAVRLLGFSTAATDLVARHPDEAMALADVSARTRAGLDRELEADLDRLGPPAGLRRFRRSCLLYTLTLPTKA
jgi:hypothetical protein